MSEGKIEIRVLSRFEVVAEGQDVTEALTHRRRGADLVKLLALDGRHRLARERIMDALWPGLGADRAAANLRKAAHHARLALGSATSIVLDGDTARLGEEWSVETDVGLFEKAAKLALADGPAEACRQAAALYRGKLLPDDLYASWSLEPRRLLHDLYLRCLEGGEIWGHLVEVDPIHERGHQEIISAHLANGDRAAALRQFERLRAALRDQLGVLPSARSMSLYEEALSLDSPDTPSAAERARALLAWGVVHWERHDAEEAERTAKSARALAIDAGLGRELAEASELLGLIAHAQGRWRKMFADEFTESIRNTPDLAPFILDAHMCMSEFALGEVDGLVQIADLADSIERTAVEVGSNQGRALALLLRGETILLGDIDAAMAVPPLEEARRLHREADSTSGTVLALERLAQAHDVAGEAEAARRRHRAALDLASDSSVRRHLLPFVFGGILTDQSGGAALALLEEAEQATVSLDLCPPCAMSYRVAAARICASVGEIELGNEYLDIAADVTEMWRGGPWYAAVTEAKAALVAGSGGSREEVRRLLEESASGFASAGRLRDEARCREAMATV